MGQFDGDPVTLSATWGTVTKNDDGTWSWTGGTSTSSGLVIVTATDKDGSMVTGFSLDVRHLPKLSVFHPAIASAPGLNATNTGTWSDVDGDTVALSASSGLGQQA